MNRYLVGREYDNYHNGFATMEEAVKEATERSAKSEVTYFVFSAQKIIRAKMPAVEQLDAIVFDV